MKQLISKSGPNSMSCQRGFEDRRCFWYFFSKKCQNICRVREMREFFVYFSKNLQVGWTVAAFPFYFISKRHRFSDKINDELGVAHLISIIQTVSSINRRMLVLQGKFLFMIFFPIQSFKNIISYHQLC